MRIVKKKPILWFIVKLFFPKADLKTSAFTFGNTIYTFCELAPHQIVHEKVHMEQQGHSKVYATLFFILYVFSKKFRREVEIEAYKKQFEYIKNTTSDPKIVSRVRSALASFMASPLYNMMTYNEALFHLCESSE